MKYEGHIEEHTQVKRAVCCGVRQTVLKRHTERRIFHCALIISSPGLAVVQKIIKHSCRQEYEKCVTHTHTHTHTHTCMLFVLCSLCADKHSTK